ncbi:unnamed protein product [Prunus brigantina]
MVSQDQSKNSGSKKNGGKELGMVTPQDKSSKKMKFVSSAETKTEPTSMTTISEDSKSGRVLHWCVGMVQSPTCGQEMG